MGGCHQRWQGGVGEVQMGERGQKLKPPVIRYVSPGDVMYGLVTTINNTGWLHLKICESF